MNNEINNTLPATLSDRLAALKRETVTEAAEVWQPEPGDVLAGVYVGHKQIEHPRYGVQWQLLLKDEAGLITAAWINQWLRQNLKAQSLALGDLVCIGYLGKRKTSSGNAYNAYSLKVAKA